MTQPLAGWMQEAASTGGNLSTQIQALAGANGVDLSNPLISQNLHDVLATAKAEGIDALNLGQEQLSRVKTLFESFNQVYNSHSMQGAANAVAQSIGAARQFVTSNHELSGALGATQGLVTAFANASKNGSTNPIDLVAGLSGPIMAAAVAAGAASMGVGAAVVAVIAIADELLDAAGVFGAPKPGFTVGGPAAPPWEYTGSSQTPTMTINGTVVYDDHNVQVISPTDRQDWRHFPEPNNKDDSFWFSLYGPKTNFTQWRGAAWIVNPNLGDAGSDNNNMFLKMWRDMAEKMTGAPDSFTHTPMSSLFPEWWAANLSMMPGVRSFQGATLDAEKLNALQNFTHAFFQAWKANKEWWLNGRQGGADLDVLAHLITLWNRSHDPGEGLDVQPEYPSQGEFLGPSRLYWVTLINSLRTGGKTSVLGPDGSSVHLHTGPEKHMPSKIAQALQARGAARRAAAARQINLPHLNPQIVALPLGPLAQAMGPQKMPTRIHLLEAAIERTVHRYERYLPAAVGLVAVPFVGPIGLIGVAATGGWLLKDKLKKK